mmetsp:Transcript_3565/g.5387  ORF Transcript_3565/g.5387 Transcript_3565/m.5387 type:complete len:211 (-) Transcript_3565:31-663(-)
MVLFRSRLSVRGVVTRGVVLDVLRMRFRGSFLVRQSNILFFLALSLRREEFDLFLFVVVHHILVAVGALLIRLNALFVAGINHGELDLLLRVISRFFDVLSFSLAAFFFLRLFFLGFDLLVVLHLSVFLLVVFIGNHFCVCLRLLLRGRGLFLLLAGVVVEGSHVLSLVMNLISGFLLQGAHLDVREGQIGLRRIFNFFLLFLLLEFSTS